jgi:hypothetical protein
MKIAVCVPVHGAPKFGFMNSLSGLLLQTVYGTLPQPHFLHVFSAESSNLLFNRNTIAANALSWSADYLLWLDSDHEFPADSLLRLLAHNKSVVAVNQPTRNPPHDPMALGLDGKPISSRGRSGVEEVRGSGLCMALVSAEAMKSLPQPFFTGVNEDMAFADALRRSGHAWFVDHDLSMQVGHISEAVITFSPA